MPPVAMPPLPADAVLCPREYAPKGINGRLEKLEPLRQEFGPVLGGGAHPHLIPAMQMYLITKDGGPAEGGQYTFYFPNGHPRQGENRYVWYDRGDGIQYGWLVPDDHKATTVPEAIAEKLAQEREKFLASEAGKAFAAKHGLTAQPTSEEPAKS